MKCQEVIIAGIPATADTSKKVWDDLKKKYDKASAASVLLEICKVFSFQLSGGDPTSEIQKLALSNVASPSPISSKPRF